MRRLTDIIYHRGEERSGLPHVPSNTCVVAVSPVRGDVESLAALHHKILLHTASMPPIMRKIIVYGGDYSGTTQSGADVLDLFLSAPLPGFERAFLVGPGDLRFLSFIKGEGVFSRWLDQRNWNSVAAPRYLNDEAIQSWLTEQGGAATLASYGVTVPRGGVLLPLQLAAMRRELLLKIPLDHIDFLEKLQMEITVGDYLFINPMIRSQVPLHAEHNHKTFCRFEAWDDEQGPVKGTLIVKDKSLFIHP